MGKLQSIIMMGIGGVIWAGCSCQPEIPQEPNEQDPEEETGSTGATGATGDTAPDLACTRPEIEPNDSVASPTVIELEQQLCGDFSSGLDLDNFAFELDEDAWLAVETEARSLGSLADMNIFLEPASGVSFNRQDDENDTDVTLLFPAKADSYNLLLGSQDLTGDEEGRYFYQAMVSKVKAPITWNFEEVEPNDEIEMAAEVIPGESWFGRIDRQFDGDWFKVDIPPGRQTLVIDVQAYSLGSVANTTIELTDAEKDKLASCGTCTFERGELPYELDPYVEYSSLGNETVYFQVRNADGSGSVGHWYVFDVSLGEE